MLLMCSLRLVLNVRSLYIVSGALRMAHIAANRGDSPLATIM